MEEKASSSSSINSIDGANVINSDGSNVVWRKNFSHQAAPVIIIIIIIYEREI